ncbi:SPOR domain-containing protein [Acetobacter senegalensis]|uniref:SPOR domain-containing protein n=1 Tax=Acetobacter senegalensis TaxID=446692 RepID=UPI001EDC7ED1|nr:SPOR domain-containing protein [Acetobacter senegalensis]MCG4260612.1 SPOR domain-containing protein [Acetobacter senegalensis]
MSDDNKDFSSDNRISRARERMSTDYDDTLPPRRPTGPAGKGGVASSVLTQFLSSDAGTRKLVYGAAGLGGLLVLGIGGWALLGHHQSGIPVMGPPPVAMRTKPVDPGGMQLDGVAMPDTPDDGQAHPVPAPEKPNPTALAQQYGQQAASTEAADNAKKAADATGDDPDIKEAGPKGTDAGAQGTDQPQAGGAAGAQPTAEDQQPTSLPDSSNGTTDESAAGDAAAASGAATGKAAQPQTTPATPATPARKAASDSAATPAARKVEQAPAAAPLPASSGGKYRVQLAALQSEAQAQQEWSRLKTRYPTLFADRTPMVEKVQRDNAVFYRLRVAGFASTAETRTFCNAVRERGLACAQVHQ